MTSQLLDMNSAQALIYSKSNIRRAFPEFDDTEIAVAQANDSTYGLVSYVFTRDLETGLHLSEQLESGTVCLNHGAVNSAYAPYEGWKESGFGLELSRRAIFEYLKTKHVKVAL